MGAKWFDASAAAPPADLAPNMIDFSACLEMMFLESDRPLNDRVRAAADSGFRAVEIWDWWDKDLVSLRKTLTATDTTMLTLCVESWRDKCNLGDPSSHEEFLRRLTAAAAAAQDLRAKKLVVLAGDGLTSTSHDLQLNATAEVLRRSAEALDGTGLQIVLEVVNRQFEGPKALVSDTETALAVIEQVGQPSVKFLYDRYHAILNGEPIGHGIKGRLDLVGHIQVADAPGRHEFGTGAVDWAAELAWLERAEYDGYIGIEATPLGESSAVYSQARKLLRPQSKQDSKG